MLSNKVGEIMTHQLTSAPASSTIHEVLQIMVAEDVGRVILTDNALPVGIFTERHVLKRVANHRLNPKTTGVRDVMTSQIRAVSEQTHIIEALGEMMRAKIRHLLVRAQSGNIVGIVSMRRILGIAVELGQGSSETKTVGDIMSQGVPSIDESALVSDVIDLMIHRDTNALVVVSPAKQPIGIFTERDVLNRVVAKDLDTKKTAIREVMTSPLVSMPSTALIGEVLTEMYRRDIRNMPIIGDWDQLSGLVSMAEILQFARAFDIDETVRRTWKEIQNFHDSDDPYTPG